MKRILYLVNLLLCCTMSTWAQKPNNMGQIAQSLNTYSQNKSKLTKAQLESATTISYHCDNGSVSPEYHYNVYIIVTKNNVNVTIYGGYDGNVKFKEDRSITQSEYKQFINRLANQNICKKPSNGDVPFMSGSSSSDITVKVKNRIIFKGDEHVNLSIGKGSLDDSFMSLLSGTMLQAINNLDVIISKN